MGKQCAPGINIETDPSSTKTTRLVDLAGKAGKTLFLTVIFRRDENWRSLASSDTNIKSYAWGAHVIIELPHKHEPAEPLLGTTLSVNT